VSGLVLSHFTDGKQKVTSRQGETGNPSLVSTPAWDGSRRAHPRRHAVPGRPTSASATPRQSPRPASVLDLVPAPRTSVPPLPAADARTPHVLADPRTGAPLARSAAMTRVRRASPRPSR